MGRYIDITELNHHHEMFILVRPENKRFSIFKEFKYDLLARFILQDVLQWH